jgi:hypothetical protein
MSIIAVDHPCDLLPIRRISPLRTYHVTPFASRSWVTRRDTFSTVPMASPVSITSPTPYWSSRIMKMPERKSLTRLWAPKPRATPPTPAEASTGPSGIPMIDMTVRTVTVATTNVTMLRRIEPIVRVRCRCRSWASPTAPARTRPARLGSCASRWACRLVAVSTTRWMSRSSSQRATRANARMTTMSRGSPRNHVRASVQVSEGKVIWSMRAIVVDVGPYAAPRGPLARQLPAHPHLKSERNRPPGTTPVFCCVPEWRRCV